MAEPAQAPLPARAEIRRATQSEHPWRATARTVFAALVGIAALAPIIYAAATQGDPGQATGWAAIALAVAGAVTRVMAIPGVNTWLERFLPFLAAAPAGEYPVAARPVPDQPRNDNGGGGDLAPPAPLP